MEPYHSLDSSVIPAVLVSFPRFFCHSRVGGNLFQEIPKAGDDTGGCRSREPCVVPASLVSFPRRRESIPRDPQSSWGWHWGLSFPRRRESIPRDPQSSWGWHWGLSFPRRRESKKEKILNKKIYKSYILVYYYMIF